MKVKAFWDVMPRILVEVDRRFRGVYCLHHQGGEIHRPDDETTRRYIPEGYHIHTRLRENLKYYNCIIVTICRLLEVVYS
jgi:hypothetical protein